jgi:hypothetical protein
MRSQGRVRVRPLTFQLGLKLSRFPSRGARFHWQALTGRSQQLKPCELAWRARVDSSNQNGLYQVSCNVVVAIHLLAGPAFGTITSISP